MITYLLRDKLIFYIYKLNSYSVNWYIGSSNYMYSKLFYIPEAKKVAPISKKISFRILVQSNGVSS